MGKLFGDSIYVDSIRNHQCRIGVPEAVEGNMLVYLGFLEPFLKRLLKHGLGQITEHQLISVMLAADVDSLLTDKDCLL